MDYAALFRENVIRAMVIRTDCEIMRREPTPEEAQLLAALEAFEKFCAAMPHDDDWDD